MVGVYLKIISMVVRLLLWQCSIGHKWLASLERVKNKNSWCPECNRHSIETAKSLARTKNGDCLSSDYVNNKTLLQWNVTRVIYGLKFK